MHHRLSRTLVLLILLGACASRPAPRPYETGAPAGGQDAAIRQAARTFVSALNAKAWEQAADLIAWDDHVARDERLRGLAEQLRDRYRGKPDRGFLDRPVFEDSSVTRRELMRSDDPAALFARIARERFISESGRAFAPGKATKPAEVLRLANDPGHVQATLRMPDGRVAEFRMVWRAGRWLLLPL